MKEFAISVVASIVLVALMFGGAFVLAVIGVCNGLERIWRRGL